MFEDISKPIDSIGNAIDKIFTSDDERLTHKEILERLRQAPDTAQHEINKIEAKSNLLFIAGWRPFIGWICGFSVLYSFFIQPILFSFGFISYQLNSSELMPLVLAMLGMSANRTLEKIKGVTETYGINLPEPRETRK